MTTFPTNLKAFVSEQKWTFAKTCAATWPYEYIVQDRVDEGRAERLESVERAVANVRSSRTLTPGTLKAMVESPDFSAATKFWTWPSAAEMEAGLGTEELDFWNLPKNERPLLKKLRASSRPSRPCRWCCGS